MMTALAASRAYGAVQKSMSVDPGSGGVGAAPGAGFGDMLKSAMGEVMKSTHNAETQMAAQVHGKAELVDVVTAISAAETSLETVMAVRDQVINAYQEIMRMPI